MALHGIGAGLNLSGIGINRFEIRASALRALFFLSVSQLVIRGVSESHLFNPEKFAYIAPFIVVFIIAPLFLPDKPAFSKGALALDALVVAAFIADMGVGSPIAAAALLLPLDAGARGEQKLALGAAAAIPVGFTFAILTSGNVNTFRLLFWLAASPLSWLATRIHHYADGMNKFRTMYLDLEAANQELEEQIKFLEQKVSTHTIIDPVTGLKNFRYFRSRIEEEMSRARRSKTPFSICVGEIDDFDDFLRGFGRRDLDIAVQRISQNLCESVRTTDLVGRLSERRFIMLLLDSDSKSSLIPALRIKRSLLEVGVGPERVMKMTLSMGIATFPTDVQEIGGLISLASSALDRSRQKGKGMITLASSIWKGHQNPG